MTLTKKQLISLRGNECEECHIGPEWNGKPFTFDEHHLDYDRKNNDESNRIILCPICHRQYHLRKQKGFGEKMSVLLTGRKLSDEHKKNIGNASRGRKYSDEIKKKFSASKVGDKNPMYGKIPWNKGKKNLYHHSEETKLKQSIALKGKTKSEEFRKSFIGQSNPMSKINREKRKNAACLNNTL